ncbi:MAG: hypothetical protein SFU56_04005 [Capsulimonadales bacterium]|nr:hypothetical protein [Capsulimonadales bacterium]
MHSDGLAGKTETFVRYGVTPRLEVGFGYLWKQSIVRPLATYTLLPETAARPAWTTGVLTDSLGGGRSGLFTTLAKDIEENTRLPLSLYIGTAVVSNERDRWRFLTGANVRVARGLNLSAQFDGRYVNLGLVGQVGTVGGVPIRLGIVAARGNKIGPLAAASFPLGTADH